MDSRTFQTELLDRFQEPRAQQAVDWWNNRNDVIAFRAALDDEVAGNLAQYRERMKQNECIKNRLDMLDAWQRDWREGKGRTIDGEIGRPLAYPPVNVIWPMGANGVAICLPLFSSRPPLIA